MSMDLYVWKRPMVSEDAAPQLLERFYEEGDTSAFEPSEDVSRFYDELVAMSTDFEGERSDRIIDLSLSWSVPDDILNGIVALAQKHDLVLYDPQGPSFHSPLELLGRANSSRSGSVAPNADRTPHRCRPRRRRMVRPASCSELDRACHRRVHGRHGAVQHRRMA